MLSVIGDLLPLAASIAISPMPIIAAILMILSPHANQLGTGFLIGWMVGLTAATIVLAMLGQIAGDGDPNKSHPLTGVILLVAGSALMYLGYGQWQSRPKSGESAPRPAWMNAINQMNFRSALWMGVLLSGLNIKNVMYEASAGAIIGDAVHSYGELIVILAIFVLLSSLTVGGPIIAYRISPERFAAPLESARVWLEQNNATIMTIILFLIGLNVFGKGLGSF